MSLPREDARCRLDPEYHAALLAICDAEGVTIAQFLEQLLVPVIRDRVHAANVIAQRTVGLGIGATKCDTAGEGGK
jgi:hypothetical protein